MLIIYRILINLILILSPIIFIYRLLKKKESLESYKQKIGFFFKGKNKKKLIWFHGASVGELKSIVPLLEKFEKNNKVNQILVTSNTLSSFKIIKNLKLKKTFHQFFPIDSNFITKKFINHWKPQKVYFIDSEIWPNMLLNLKQNKIPVALINGRITKKTFRRWRLFSNSASELFSQIDVCLPSSLTSFRYLKKLNVKKLRLIGNLKFSQSELELPFIDKKLKYFLNKKKTWCASSTHNSEELLSGIVHLKLKKKINNLLTIIIPRHIERCEKIKKNLEKLNLKVHMDQPRKKISLDTDIYLVNSYGKTNVFFDNTNNVFLGGSLINHGGQNPLEAARLGCNILNGPNTQNFDEIYKFLEKNNISQRVVNQFDLASKLYTLLNKENKSKKVKNKIKKIGQNILEKTYKEINLI